MVGVTIGPLRTTISQCMRALNLARGVIRADCWTKKGPDVSSTQPHKFFVLGYLATGGHSQLMHLVSPEDTYTGDGSSCGFSVSQHSPFASGTAGGGLEFGDWRWGRAL